MYCKCQILKVLLCHLLVLIVAKCIVNSISFGFSVSKRKVLIVAKCIVNLLSAQEKYVKQIVLIVAKCIVNTLSFNDLSL